MLFLLFLQEGVLVVRRNLDNFVLEDEKDRFELPCMLPHSLIYVKCSKIPVHERSWPFFCSISIDNFICIYIY